MIAEGKAEIRDKGLLPYLWAIVDNYPTALVRGQAHRLLTIMGEHGTLLLVSNCSQIARCQENVFG